MSDVGKFHIFFISGPLKLGAASRLEAHHRQETLVDLRSTGGNEPNIYSASSSSFFFLWKNIFSDTNAISPTINLLGIRLEII